MRLGQNGQRRPHVAGAAGQAVGQTDTQTDLQTDRPTNTQTNRQSTQATRIQNAFPPTRQVCFAFMQNSPYQTASIAGRQQPMGVAPGATAAAGAVQAGAAAAGPYVAWPDLGLSYLVGTTKSSP